MGLYKYIILFLIIPTLTLAKTYKSNSFYNEYFLGEQEMGTYYGPFAPDHKFNSLTGKVDFVDEEYFDAYFDNSLQPEIMRLSKIWFEEFPNKSKCPDYFLNENINYIRYLYRLMALSYLYEGIKHSSQTLYSLGLTASTCSITWKETFKSCRPRGMDMRKFLKRVKGKVKKANIKYVRLNENQKINWLNHFRSGKRPSYTAGVVDKRLRYGCQQSGTNCQKIKFGQIKEMITSQCKQDKQLLKNVCSEKDMLYGISNVKELVSILENSNVLNVINKGGFGRRCLERFSEMFETRERKIHRLKIFFT